MATITITLSKHYHKTVNFLNEGWSKFNTRDIPTVLWLPTSSFYAKAEFLFSHILNLPRKFPLVLYQGPLTNQVPNCVFNYLRNYQNCILIRKNLPMLTPGVTNTLVHHVCTWYIHIDWCTDRLPVTLKRQSIIYKFLKHMEGRTIHG